MTAKLVCGLPAAIHSLVESGSGSSLSRLCLLLGITSMAGILGPVRFLDLCSEALDRTSLYPLKTPSSFV